MENADDYYVRLKDLTTAGTLTSTSWQNDYTLLPDVSTNVNYTNGNMNTYNILKDCYNLGKTSNAAMAARRNTYNHRGTIYYGFMLSRPQLNDLISEYLIVYDALTFFGYTGNYRTKYIWSSTQYSSLDAWYWYSTSWNFYGKNRSTAVLPAFAIS